MDIWRFWAGTQVYISYKVEPRNYRYVHFGMTVIKVMYFIPNSRKSNSNNDKNFRFTISLYCDRNNLLFSTFLMHSIWWNGLHTLQHYLRYFVRYCCHLGKRFTTRSTNQRLSIALTDLLYFYARKQLSPYCFYRVLAIAILSVHLCPSVRHTRGSVKSGASCHYQIFTVSCTKLSLCDPDREFGILYINLAWTPQFSANILNRNCYGLSRVSWALAQISCPFSC